MSASCCDIYTPTGAHWCQCQKAHDAGECRHSYPRREGERIVLAPPRVRFPTLAVLSYCLRHPVFFFGHIVPQAWRRFYLCANRHSHRPEAYSPGPRDGTQSALYQCRDCGMDLTAYCGMDSTPAGDERSVLE